MCAIHIGIGHDDYLVIAQFAGAVIGAKAGPQSLTEIRQLLIGRQLFTAGIGNIEDFSAQWQYSLILAVAGLLGRAAGRISFNDKQLRSRCCAARTIRQLTRQAQFTGGAFAIDLLFLAAAQAFLCTVDNPFQQFGSL